MILPKAPARISDTQIISPIEALDLTRVIRYQQIATIATKRNILRINLPIEPPNSMPKAMPLFSVKWMINQLVILNSWPSTMCVLIQIFITWSINKTRNIVNAANFPLLIFNTKSSPNFHDENSESC